MNRKFDIGFQASITHRLQPMTICIGAICDRRESFTEKAIVASDRMVTAGDFSVAFEHEQSKIVELSGNCVALTAGPALVHTDLFRKVKVKFHSGATPPISEIVDKVKEEYLKIRNKKIEEKFFRVRGFSIEWFREHQRMMSPEIVMRLDRQLETHEFNLHILVAGVDHAGAHIYWVYPPCSSECFEALGYCSIGTGERHADSTFIAYRFTPSIPLKNALYIIYEAKKKAEIAVGVGTHTDMAIIDENGIKNISDQTMKELENIYNKKIELATLKNEEIDKSISALSV